MNNFTFQLTRSISQSGNYNGDLGNYGPMSAHSALSAHSPGSPYHNTRASQGSLNLMHSSSRPSLNKVRWNKQMREHLKRIGKDNTRHCTVKMGHEKAFMSDFSSPRN